MPLEIDPYSSAEPLLAGFPAFPDTERDYRFLSYLTYEDGCLLWTGPISDLGYARFIPKGVNFNAHKWYWERIHGPVPEGLELGHYCKHRHCVIHVRPITHLQNMRESWPALATHCAKGHSMHNCIKRKSGGRKCRECHYESARRYKAKVRGR